MPANDMETIALARIETEILKQKLVLSNLYTRKNSFSFVSRLPTEILATIFILCARDYHSEDQNHSPPTWLNVSYVCYHWREVALNCPTLWTYVSTMPHRWTEEFLDRSKKAILKIRIKLLYVYHVPQWWNSVEKAMHHVERIQELSLDLPGTHSNKVLLMLSSRAPCLQNLKISLRDYPSESPVVLFDGDTPALRALELSNCPVPLSSFKLSGLTTLKLCRVPPRLRHNIEELLATLSCMQDLVQLYLDRALTNATGFVFNAAFNTLQKIYLPHLSRLLIAAPLSTLTALLSCVNVPSDAEFRLECQSEADSSLDGYSLLSPVLGQRFSVAENHAPSSQAIHSLVIDSTTWNEKYPRLTFGTSGRDHISHFSKSRAEWGCNVPLQIAFEEVRIDRDRIISDICCSMPLTHLQSIHVFHPPTSSAFWMRTFGHLQDLRYIKLSQGDMPELASLLYDDCAEDQDGRTPNQIFAPALEELEVVDITFAADPPEWDTTDTLGTDLLSLQDAISTREQARLITTRCVVDVESDSEEDEASYGCSCCDASRWG
ncbi:hypothetical protein OG21DRAFT_1507762 [Imleria badia]|nr:hypothetical protein OG21DRAFT_1507762 [Imleria badia]